MKTKLLTACVAIVATAATMILTAPPSSAGTSSCPPNHLCLWEDQSFQTNGNGAALYAVDNYVAHLGSQKYAGTNDYVGDSSTSGFNSSGTSRYRLYQDANCEGAYFTVNALWSDANFGNGDPTFTNGASANDQVSSVWRVGDATALTDCRNG